MVKRCGQSYSCKNLLYILIDYSLPLKCQLKMSEFWGAFTAYVLFCLIFAVDLIDFQRTLVTT